MSQATKGKKMSGWEKLLSIAVLLSIISSFTVSSQDDRRSRRARLRAAERTEQVQKDTVEMTDSMRAAIEETAGVHVRVLDYSEHALGEGSHAQAAAYIKVMDVDSGKVTYGVGVSPNITRASHRALFSGLNRLFK